MPTLKPLGQGAARPHPRPVLAALFPISAGLPGSEAVYHHIPRSRPRRGPQPRKWRLPMSPSEQPTPPGPPYALLSARSVGVRLCPLRFLSGHLGRFSQLCGGDQQPIPRTNEPRTLLTARPLVPPESAEHPPGPLRAPLRAARALGLVARLFVAPLAARCVRAQHRPVAADALVPSLRATKTRCARSVQALSAALLSPQPVPASWRQTPSLVALHLVPARQLGDDCGGPFLRFAAVHGVYASCPRRPNTALLCHLLPSHPVAVHPGGNFALCARQHPTLPLQHW